jgi:hypothetical protein
MSFTYSVNQRPNTGGYAMYLVLANFIAAGWTVRTSSDGTTYKSTPGSQITSGATGANGMANDKAWFRIQDPGGGREFVVQRGTGGNLNWGIKYSVAAKFTGGSPSATQVPTATDEVKILGDITGVTQTYARLWGFDGQINLHMGMGDASIHYAFWMFGIQIATTNASTAGSWMMDYVTGADTGDLDPTVHYSNNTTGDLRLVAASPVAFCYFTSISSANFQNVQIQPSLFYGPQTGNLVWNNGWNSFEDILPAPWASTTYGWKGWSSIFQMFTQNVHYSGDMASIGNPPVMGTKNYMLMGEQNGGVILQWPASAGDMIN